MTRYRSHLLANFAGSGTGALFQLAFIPLYIKFLGMESYGLVGFQIMILSLMPILDLGLGTTMNREMARYSVSSSNAREAGDFALTLEIVYWVLGISAGVAIVAAAPFIADRWVNADALPRDTIIRALMLIGGTASLQLPFWFYQGGLMGLQRQVLFNCVKILMSFLGSGGAVLFLWLVSPTITAFLAWQFAVAVMQIAVLRFFLWRYLACKGEKPGFSLRLLRSTWHFAAGMGGITICYAILSHIDKILLSKMLTLKMFGYYSIATAAGSCIVLMVRPVFDASFPQFSAMAASHDKDGIRNLYRRSNQLVAALVMPVAAVLLFFPKEALLAWTGNPETAETAAPIARFLAAGFAVHGVLIILYSLQLAHGWTRL
ncbi:MAG: oligosaccharide flippase family protein, partial [Syntrophorhabdaceae bacterium]|nr:oligosaccharide flippase family protein [Syntrophorhabdaceae bacterium]